MAESEDIQPLVCDNGTGMVKAGFAGDDAPRAKQKRKKNTIAEVEAVDPKPKELRI